MLEDCFLSLEESLPSLPFQQSVIGCHHPSPQEQLLRPSPTLMPHLIFYFLVLGVLLGMSVFLSLEIPDLIN